jgi:hypothetical protein
MSVKIGSFCLKCLMIKSEQTKLQDIFQIKIHRVTFRSYFYLVSTAALKPGPVCIMLLCLHQGRSCSDKINPAYAPP